MSVENENLRSRLLQELNSLYEDKFYESLDVTNLSTLLSISTREFETLITPLLAKRWVEKELKTIRSYRLRLTDLGKEEFDRSRGDNTNESIRGKLLALLSDEFEKNPGSVTDSDSLSRRLDLHWNKVCFNLKIMEAHSLVELHERAWAGHPFYRVSLTAEGKTAHDYPRPRILFLSHAAIDEPIAAYLKPVITDALPGVHVFVSTDPEDLRPGDPWVEKILRNLLDAECVLVLSTDRGLTRRWVWFEAGAGWVRRNRIVSCCVGKQRKGSLPPPFSIYQSLNIDEEKDCRVLFGTLTDYFGALSQEPEYADIVSNLRELDTKAAERWAAVVAPPNGLALAEVDAGLAKLDEAERQALSLLLLYGELTDVQVIQKLVEKGVLDLSQSGIFLCSRIAHKTGIVEQSISHSDRERHLGVHGPWRIKPTLRHALEVRLFGT